jgi:CheY-like chemotaxis protein
MNNKQTVPTILVVDDHISNLNLLQLYLTAQDYRVELAMNGYDALKKLANTEIDLIITDICMPGMDGNALYHAVQDSQGGAEIPIIAMSATPWEANAGFVKVFRKPYQVQELAVAIDDLLNGQTDNVITLSERNKG